MSFAQRITRIKGLSDRRRLPRLGIIRLGLKALSKGGKEYPKETSYFVVPEEVAAEYGDKPTELDIMLPLNELDAVFPTAYKFYGQSKGLKCSGDGEIAYQANENREFEDRKCPCELLDQGKCKQVGTLMVMLPKVSVGGVYQITTSSYNSIIDVNSCLEFVSALIGRFAMVPLKLKRVPTETHHNGSKQTHYTLQIVFEGNIETLNALRMDTQRILEHPRYQLPAPREENPEFDPVDIIDEEDEVTPAETIDAETGEIITGEGTDSPMGHIKEVFPDKVTDEVSEAKKAALGKIQTTMVKLWPEKTQKNTKAKGDFLMAVFGTRSWTETTERPLRELTDVIKVLDEFEGNYTEGTPVAAIWQRTIMGDIAETKEESSDKPELDKTMVPFLASVDIIRQELEMSLGKEKAEEAIKKALSNYEAKSFEDVKKSEHGAFITYLSGLKDNV